MLQLDAQLCRLSDIFSCHLAYCRFHLAFAFLLLFYSHFQFQRGKKRFEHCYGSSCKLNSAVVCVCGSVGIGLGQIFQLAKWKVLATGQQLPPKLLASTRNTCVNTNANPQKVKSNRRKLNSISIAQTAQFLMRINCVAAFANEIISSGSREKNN